MSAGSLGRLSEAHASWLELSLAAGLFSQRTVYVYRYGAKSFIESQGDLLVEDVTRLHAKRWLLEARGLAPSTITCRIASLNSFYDELLFEDLIEFNPFAKLRRPKQRRGQPRPAPVEATRHLLAAAAPRERTMIALAVMLGLRRFEIAKLAVADFDFDTMRLSLVGKGNKPAVLPITVELAEIVEEWIDYAGLQPGGWLFPSKKGGHLVAMYVGQVMTKASAEAGVRITPHQYRHRAGTDMTRAYGLKAAQQLLRHASSATTEVYSQFDVEDLRPLMTGVELGQEGRA